MTRRPNRTTALRATACAALALMAGAATTLTLPAPASACGGFFCNRQIPIDQSGEQIVFSIDESGVTAHILIQFTGKAQDFAWVVPVMVKPTIGLGTMALFRSLLQQTQPQYTMDTSKLNQCFGGRGGIFAAPSTAGSADSKVNVVESRDVGPYNTVILESSDAGALVKWLRDAGYDQPESSTPLIEHYVKEGALFVALKLKQDAGTGEIQPLVLEMPHTEACVPLILTRVAAVKDMPVQAFILGKHRAFPSNWFHVEINQKRIDWPNGGQNYRTLVTEAVNEAAGHGFVTEYAGTTEMLKNSVYQAGRFNLEALRPITDPSALVMAVFRQGFPGDQTMQALFRRHIPMPDSVRARGVSEQQFYNQLAQGSTQYRADFAGFQVDTAAFIADLDERIVTPLRKAQAMIDGQPYLTRLYSTVSPDEMTRDPMFHFNAEMPRVSNIHRARAIGGICQSDGTIANLVLELETGERVGYESPVSVPWWTTLPAGGIASTDLGPAAARIELVGPRGLPVGFSPGQAKATDRALDTQTPEMVRMNPPAGTIATASDGGFFGCALGGRPASGSSGLGLGLGLALSALALARRRR